jgi:biotin-(acetyl-CoA carboxylase) ligase
VLGLGLNVNQTSFPDSLPNATSLALEFGAQDREQVLARVVSAILFWHEHPDRLVLWRRRAHTLGRVVEVAGRRGVATGLRDDGALLVDGEPVLTGEVSAN